MKAENFIRQEVCDYSTIYIDMDSFFASVEQFYDKSLRGKPVAVATGNSRGSSIVAASYDAKAKGIKTGTRVYRALELCPNLVVVEDSPDRYRQVHREFMAIFHNTFCKVIPKGIDEAFLKVPSYAQNREEVFALVKAIKASLYNLYNEHIDCSIGVASNSWLAKQAASYSKPKGFISLTSGEVSNFYKGLTLTSLTGIGDRMARQFANHAIYTPTDLYNASWKYLGTNFGVNGHKWYLRLRGYEVDMPIYKQQKSISNQVTMGLYKPSTLKEITTFVTKICENLSSRLVKKSLNSNSLEIIVYFCDRTRATFKIENTAYMQDTNSIKSVCIMLLNKHKYFKEVLKICVALYGLSAVWQVGLFENTESDRLERAARAVHLIRNRYGSGTSASAASYFESSISLNRVGFAGDLLKETGSL